MNNKNVVERDRDGNITKEIRYDGKGEVLFTHVTEWKDGRIVRKTSYDAKGAETGSCEYEYDERGNNIKGSWFVYNKGFLMEAEFVYDPEDRIIEKTHFGKGSIATNKTYYTYNAEGKILCEEYYGAWPDCAPCYTYNEYGSDGVLVKSRTEDENHNLQHYELYRSNESGKISEYTSYDEKGKALYSYKYYFDAEGNKTKTERYDGDGKLVSST
ncbi:MAG: hypothetical protein J5528_03760 [Firmicutes bacterium]|nr:hypothetical protein [Bacillota bacterium]